MSEFTVKYTKNGEEIKSLKVKAYNLIQAEKVAKEKEGPDIKVISVSRT